MRSATAAALALLGALFMPTAGMSQSLVFADGFETGDLCVWIGEPAAPWYPDLDGDGFGNSDEGIVTCTPPPGWVPIGGDCDDSDPNVHPGAPELCNGIDDDCNGKIDDDAIDASTWYRDADGDGYGDPNDFVVACEQPPGYVDNDLDCDDSDPDVFDCCDLDGDGWTTCDGDCCDAPGDCSIPPALVNPGAFEIVGNGVDDNCDGVIDEVTPPCSTTQDFDVTANDLAAAMDICQQASVGDPLPVRRWGLLSAALRRPDGTAPSAAQLNVMQTKQAAVLTEYGTVIVPEAHGTMVGLSSGVMRDQGDPGYVGVNTDHGYTGNPPAVFLAAHGGQLPGSQGCSGSCPSGTGANDGVNLRLTLRAPTNAVGLAVSQRFFVADFGSWMCSLYNDYFLVLLSSGWSGLPADRNIAFDAVDNLLSLNNAFFEVCSPQGCHSCPAGTAALTGTGLAAVGGAGTQWRQAVSPIVPGETLTLEIMVFDVSDGEGDVIALIDGFRWIAHEDAEPDALGGDADPGP